MSCIHDIQICAKTNIFAPQIPSAYKRTELFYSQASSRNTYANSRELWYERNIFVKKVLNKVHTNQNQRFSTRKRYQTEFPWKTCWQKVRLPGKDDLQGKQSKFILSPVPSSSQLERNTRPWIFWGQRGLFHHNVAGGRGRGCGHGPVCIKMAGCGFTSTNTVVKIIGK